jgi:hypothetical protein
MLRNNGGKNRYYTDSSWNRNQGLGDVAEIRKRQTWPELSYWQSDDRLLFAKPVEIKKEHYIQNEYFYIGSAKGLLSISWISVEGRDAQYFSVDKHTGNIRQGDHLRVKVSFRSKKRVSINTLNAYLEIKINENQISKVEFGIDTDSRTTGDLLPSSGGPSVQNIDSENPSQSESPTHSP